MQIKQQRAERSWCGWPWTLPATTWQWKPNPVKKKRVAAAWFHGVEAKVKSFPHVPTAFLFKIADPNNHQPRSKKNISSKNILSAELSDDCIFFFFGKRMKTIGCVWRGQTKMKKYTIMRNGEKQSRERKKSEGERPAAGWPWILKFCSPFSFISLSKVPEG